MRRRGADTTVMCGYCLVAVSFFGFTLTMFYRCYPIMLEPEALDPQLEGPLFYSKSNSACRDDRRFCLVGAKFLDPTGNSLIDFLAEDWFYPQLLVLTCVVFLVAIYLMWLSMKLFRHS